VNGVIGLLLENNARDVPRPARRFRALDAPFA
jgi:hypothetical protein